MKKKATEPDDESEDTVTKILEAQRKLEISSLDAPVEAIELEASVDALEYALKSVAGEKDELQTVRLPDDQFVNIEDAKGEGAKHSLDDEPPTEETGMPADLIGDDGNDVFSEASASGVTAVVSAEQEEAVFNDEEASSDDTDRDEQPEETDFSLEDAEVLET